MINMRMTSMAMSEQMMTGLDTRQGDTYSPSETTDARGDYSLNRDSLGKLPFMVRRTSVRHGPFVVRRNCMRPSPFVVRMACMRPGPFVVRMASAKPVLTMVRECVVNAVTARGL
ncbi:hypothetical protein ACOMHN_002133 [Nucella lapillus]